MTSKKVDNFNFETALTELNQLVEKMERGGINLVESLQDFEKGINLARRCQKELQIAEQRVSQLLESNGQLALVPYEIATDESM